MSIDLGKCEGLGWLKFHSLGSAIEQGYRMPKTPFLSNTLLTSLVGHDYQDCGGLHKNGPIGSYSRMQIGTI